MTAKAARFSLFTFHDLLRRYAIERGNRADTETDRRAGWHRLLDHHLHTAHQAARLYNPLRPGLALASRWLGRG